MFTPGQATVLPAKQVSTLSRVFRAKGRPVVLVVLGAGMHAGHSALIRAARRIPGAIVVVAIHPGEHPKLIQEQVDVVLHYDPQDFHQATRILAPDLGLEDPVALGRDLGQVLALLGIVAPTDLVCGEKDYELLIAIQQMITDFHLPVNVRAVPVVRTPDGVALSLRNARIPEQQREQVVGLAAALVAGAHVAEAGAQAVEEACREVLAAAGVEAEYVAVRGLRGEQPPAQGDGRLLLAATIAGVRILDNVGVPLGVGFKNLEAQHPHSPQLS